METDRGRRVCPRLRCPQCRTAWGDEPYAVWDAENVYSCPGCATTWRAENGIPVLTNPKRRAEDVSFPESIYREILAREDMGYFLFWGRRLALEQLVRDRIAGSQGCRVLDVGCGTGYVLARMQELGNTVTGVEASPTPLAFARQRNIALVFAAEAERLPFEDAEFDLVVSMDVYEHIEDDVAAMAEAWRVTAPGGTHAVLVPAMSCLWSRCDEVGGHHRRYTASELSGKLESAGFRVLRTTYLLMSFFPVALAIRTINRWFLREKQGRNAAIKEYTMPPAWINAFCRGIMAAEAHYVRMGRLPFGITVAAIAAKPAD